MSKWRLLFKPCLLFPVLSRISFQIIGYFQQNLNFDEKCKYMRSRFSTTKRWYYFFFLFRNLCFLCFFYILWSVYFWICVFNFLRLRINILLFQLLLVICIVHGKNRNHLIIVQKYFVLLKFYNIYSMYSIHCILVETLKKFQWKPFLSEDM